MNEITLRIYSFEDHHAIAEVWVDDPYANEPNPVLLRQCLLATHDLLGDPLEPGQLLRDAAAYLAR